MKTDKKTQRHTITIPGYIWAWAKENDPQKRISPATFIKEFLAQKIAESWNGEEDEDEDEDNEDTGISLSADAIELVEALHRDGLTLVSPLKGAATRAKQHGACTISRLLSPSDAELEDIKGEVVLFARFSRECKGKIKVYSLPVLPKWRNTLNEIWDWSSSQSPP